MAGFFPNTRYFDARFDLLQVQIDELRRGQESLKEEIKYRFADVDKRLDEFKKDVDKRFEQVDKRFEEIISSINRLADNLENRDKDQRNFTLRMFSISIAISIIGALGAFLKTMGVF